MNVSSNKRKKKKKTTLDMFQHKSTILYTAFSSLEWSFAQALIHHISTDSNWQILSKFSVITRCIVNISTQNFVFLKLDIITWTNLTFGIVIITPLAIICLIHTLMPLLDLTHSHISLATSNPLLMVDFFLALPPTTLPIVPPSCTSK